jgi:pSer/pThr/pTyr-binding forkhead associated (FHA) protein
VDLGSTNGTRVNGVRVKEQLLTDGDEIEVGTSTVVFEAS